MNDWPENHIAAQALQAMRLRRQLERGDFTHAEYLAHLNALQGNPEQTAAQEPRAMAESALATGGKSSRKAGGPPPKLIGALELLELRRRLEGGQLTPQEYLAQLNVQPDIAHAPVPEPASLPTCQAAATLMTAEPPVVTPQASPERFLIMKCPQCAADLTIHDRTTELQCGDCRADILVERKDFTIALRLDDGPGRIAAPPASAGRDEELEELKAEAAMVANVKRAAGIVGGICGVFFAYMGIVDIAARQIVMGAGVFFCGSALLGIVVCITRHTSKVRADLALQIRALSANEEYAADHA